MNRSHWSAGKQKLYWARYLKWRFLLFSRCHIQLLVTPWNATCQASLSFTISLSLLKLMSTESMRPFNYLIFCHPLLLLSSTFSNEVALCIRWLKNWSFNISPYNEYAGWMSFKIDWFDSLAVQGTLKSLLQQHSSKASILWCSAFFTLTSIHDYWKNHSFN